ncbi:MAG: amino acid permease [Terriglobia bacterium]|jgi:APA family basic amino acid/polyamine antiporter
MTSNPPTLRKELTLISATALVVSNMIGTGIFTTTGFLAGDLGRPSLVLAIWLVGAVMVIAGCLSYAELGINFPRSGGEYVYLREAWGPSWGFMSGWVSFCAGFAAPVALSAMAFSEYLSAFVPMLRVSGDRRLALGFLNLSPGALLAVGLILGLALVNILGVSVAAKLQSGLSATTLGVLALFLLLAFTVGAGDWHHLSMEAARTSHHGVGAQFAASLVFVMFAYSGWNAATYVAEEMKDPERTLPRALLCGAAIVALFYFLLNVAFIYALPLESLKGVIAVGATAAHALFGAQVGGFFIGVMALALFGCVSAMSLVGPRIYYAMAKDGCFFPDAARVHPRWRTPVRAILYQAAASSLLALTGTFEMLMVYVGFALVLFTTIAAAGIFRLRKRPDWKRLPAVSWAYPLVPVLFITSSGWMLVSTLAFRPKASLLGLLTIACGGLFYRWRFHKAG